MDTSPVTNQFVDPALKLAKGFSDYGLYGIMATLFVLLALQFLLFMYRLKTQDKECRNCRNSLDEVQDARENRYGKLLEQRHTQFIEILERALSAMHVMSDSDKEAKTRLKEVEKSLEELYNLVRDEGKRIGNLIEGKDK